MVPQGTSAQGLLTNGRGLPKIDPSRRTGLGLQVVGVMARQIGTSFTFTLPVPPIADPPAAPAEGKKSES
jgi:hypothetical protein